MWLDWLAPALVALGVGLAGATLARRREAHRPEVSADDLRSGRTLH